jgi:hypothetical protein
VPTDLDPLHTYLIHRSRVNTYLTISTNPGGADLVTEFYSDDPPKEHMKLSRILDAWLEADFGNS